MCRSIGTGVVLAAFVFGATSCKNSGAVLGEDPLQPPIRDVLSYRSDVAPIFRANCSLSGCHDSASRQADLDLTQPFDVEFGAVGVRALEVVGALRIKPGDASASYLMAKVLGQQEAFGGGGERMPYGGSPLSAEATEVLRQWINDGAQNN